MVSLRRAFSFAAVAVLSTAAAFASSSPVVPFVVPSGRPDAAEVRGIVGGLKAAGFDQFLVYPSTGLDYEYLGEEYFDMYSTFLGEARKRGMKVWLYDEFNWPSGTAKGRVPSENEEWTYRELVAMTNAVGGLDWRVVVSREENVDNYCPDGNNLEADAVRRFMELTHEAYGRRFANYFGSTIPGIFTDEPAHCSSAWKMKVPPGTVLRVPYWSTMEREYSEATGGRDFRTDYEVARKAGRLRGSDIFRVWTEIRSKRFRSAYFDPIRAWCDARGILSCGHLFSEEALVGCAKVNGLALNTLKGLSAPGIDLLKSDTGRGYEWITLAFAQAGARCSGHPGIAELFGLGPCDMSFSTMRKMFWLCALHRIDTYFVATYHTRARRFDVKDTWAMFTSPTQPWYSEMPLLHESAKEAAHWARKPFNCDIAVVYPQRTAGLAAFGLAESPTKYLGGLCGELTWNQLTYELIEEDEATSCGTVIDWKDGKPFERGTGRRFSGIAETVRYLDEKYSSRPRVRDAAGRTRPGFVTRAYADGSAVAVDAASGEVIIAADGRLVPDAAACPAGRKVADSWRISLSGPSRRRMWFRSVDNGPAVSKVTLATPLRRVRFALRNYPAEKRFSVKMNGRPLVFDRPSVSLGYAYDALYRETAAFDLESGEYVFELTGGTDGKLFLPVMWMVGDFSEKEYGWLSAMPGVVRPGAFAAEGLRSFSGTAVYRAEAEFAVGERLVLDAGGAVARVRFGGRDLGAKGWMPYEWTIPPDLAGRRLPLEISVINSIRPVFGSDKAPDAAKLDHPLWIPSAFRDPSPAGLRSAKAVIR